MCEAKIVQKVNGLKTATELQKSLFKGRIAPLPHKSNPYLQSSPRLLMGHEAIEKSVPMFGKAKHPLHNHSDVLGMSAKITEKYSDSRPLEPNRIKWTQKTTALI